MSSKKTRDEEADSLNQMVSRLVASGEITGIEAVEFEKKIEELRPGSKSRSVKVRNRREYDTQGCSGGLPSLGKR